MNARELRAERAGLIDQAEALIKKAQREQRDLTPVEESQFESLTSRAKNMEPEIRRLEQFGGGPGHRNLYGGGNRIMTSESERAIVNYVRTGDRSGLRDMNISTDGEYAMSIKLPGMGELRANDTTMNVTTAADGQNVVPTGFAGQIAARMNEIRISTKLGCRQVPGVGTTVNFPYENADPNVFAATSEQADNHANNYERDAPTFGVKAFTLAKKTKKLELTEELLEDEDANLMAFIADHIGRAMGLTHNAMLLTEVAANGTGLVTYASATAIASGEPEKFVFHATLGYYLDDGRTSGWVMRPPTLGAIYSLTGDDRQYMNFVSNAAPGALLGYPVVYSNSAAATAASAKDVYFGNWYYVGVREAPNLSLIRDPYTVDGLVILRYSFRAVYGVLIAGAVGYGQHASA